MLTRTEYFRAHRIAERCTYDTEGLAWYSRIFMTGGFAMFGMSVRMPFWI